MNTYLYLRGEKTRSFAVDVHPVVLLNMADHHLRRTEQQHRVIGTLLGRVNVDGTVEITESFPVPHSETSEEVAVDIDYHRTMYELSRRVSTDEVIGWYATGGLPDENSVLIHEFYCRECTSGIVPVHLLMSGETKSDFGVRAYISCGLKIGEQLLNTEFQPVEVGVISGVPEAVGYEGLLESGRHVEKSDLASVSSELDNLKSSLQKLHSLLEKVENYVRQVVKGTKKGDISVGRYISDTLSMIPQLDNASIKKLFGDQLRDLLMILYLDKLTWANVRLAEKFLTVELENTS
ncbi:Eukaryotic translation initiation factor 3 subunit F [Galdieria sulphuraria]|uniref:Translation initiation factor eIF-3 subunit 5 n=1 Tax=Galdieria sulphuraria TaxID=130081 RepID=M2XVC7_GALSU|nr:translation initiation factor eIF-3 subunit 5 [Galdieria sulphuraria]EME27339.1 translation initiation factor eIF-3 subunit 5 [Galdieria sulphuraria]GJD09492.1 Eukaryotic translation initiation factor 3 subunit F [Galdieria sulphuraria]|eukprot:XP_005703859.1 translation initiation factor eIF-3 subunit 5 [Galdieria sulphuraria]